MTLRSLPVLIILQFVFFPYSSKPQVPTFSAFEHILLSADDLSLLALGDVDAPRPTPLTVPRPTSCGHSTLWLSRMDGISLCPSKQHPARQTVLPVAFPVKSRPHSTVPSCSFFSCSVACSPGSTHISTSMSFVLVLGPLCWLIHQQENSTTCAWEAVSFSGPARHSFRVTISERPFLTSQIRLTLPGTFSHIFFSLIMLSFFPFLLPFLPPFHPSFLPPFLMEYKHSPLVFFRTRSDVMGIAGRHRYVSA